MGMLLVPTIAKVMEVSTSAAQWTLTLNLLVGAIVTPMMGRLGDGLHKKKLLLIALACVLGGSLVAALSTTFPVLLVGRALQGVTYGIVPVTISIARRHLDPSRQQVAISSLSVTVATGLGFGFPLTGLVAQFLDFRFAYWFAAAFALSALVVVIVTIPRDARVSLMHARFDYLGAALLGVGLGSLVLGIGQGPVVGWLSPLIVSLLSVATVALTAWILTATRAANPLINVHTFRVPIIMVSHCGASALAGVIYIAISTVSIIAQAPRATGYGLELSVVASGFVILPMSIGSFTANRLVRVASRRFGLRPMLPAGAATIGIGGVFLCLVHDQAWELLAGMFVVGLGMGVIFAAIPVLIARTVGASEVGSAVSFNQVLRTIGSTVGSAIAGSIFAATMTGSIEPSGEGIEIALVVGAVTCGVVAAMLTVAVLWGRRGGAASS
jgi:MFS family permease